MQNLEISHVFNNEDLTLYHAPDDYPTTPLALLATYSQHVLVPPPPPLRSHQSEEIKDILQDEIVSTADEGFQRYTLSLLQAEEIKQLNPELLEAYHHYHSPAYLFYFF